MDLNELRKLSPGDAMQAAAKELALPSDFFDKMWNQESGRGTNMRSAAGALGHFQTMPATQHAWEQRDGASYNPDDFYDGLYMAARTMGENLAKFKDPIDATRAYNAGWNPKRWGNPETVGYVHALWGNSAPAQPGAPPTDVSAEDWPRLPSLPKGRPAPLHDEAMAKEVDIGTEVGRQDAAARTVSLTHDDEVAREADAAQVTARKDATGITEVAHEAERDPRVMPTWSVMNKITAEPADPNYDYMAHREELEAGMNDDEREYMRENVNSDASARRARAEIEYRRGLDQTYSDAGGLKTFVGQMAAGTTDPASLLMGLGTVKAFQMARVGGNALVRASLENAAVNVGVTGLSDAVGETKTTADYAMAGAQGALLGAVLSRGKVKSANEADISNIARSIHERGTQEQVAAVSKVMGDEPHLAPEQVARRVEQNEAENIGRAVDESTNGPARLDQVVPEDVRQSMEAEFTGQPEEPAKPVPDAQAAPTDEAAPEAPQAAKEPFDHALVPEEQPNIIEQLRKGDVTREVKDTSGAGIKLSWRPEPNKLKPHGNLGETLEAIQSHPTATSMDKRLAQYLSRVMSDDGLAMDIRFNLRDARSNMNSDGGVNINGTTSGIQRNPVDLTSQVHGLTRYGVYSVIHEVVHAATWHRINAWETAAGKLRPEQRKVLSQFQDLFDRYKETVQNGLPTATEDHGAKYAAKNLHEFAAQILSDTETRLVLSVMPGKPVAGKVSTALREVMSLFRKVLGLEGRNGFTEAASLVDQIIALPVDNIAFKDGTPVFAAPDTGSVPGANPIAARRARDTWADKINQHASDFIRAHPIDTSRLNVVTAKIGGISDGLALASSKSNIMKMVASLVTETTTGAAGRGPNVAVRTTMLHSKFVGNGMLDYDNAYSVFRGRNGGGVIEDAWSGNVRRKFDQKVTEEILSRKLGGYKPNADATVVEAADALEGLFDRARQGQIDAGVLGHANLPATSKGYLPQALDGIKLQAATVEDMGLLHKALSKQFQERLGFDEKFANDFAPFYTERARERSMGSKNIEGLGAGGDGLQLVRDVLDDAAQGGSFDSSIVDRARAAISKSGQGHTKKRLDVDLLAELRPGLRMMDFYVTNPLVLARSYAKRTAGVAALTEAGVHGIRGVRELRAAALSKGAEQPTLQELNAFDRVTAEILGTPVAGKVVSSGATNLGLLVGLQRLGGLVFQQVSETWQMLHHTGLRSMLDGVPTLKDKLGEVGRLRRGMPSGNHILTSMETYGGEIGMESYKMIAPLDAPDATLAQYMDQPGLVSRLLRAGGHLQSKISGFRGFLAAQHRMVAEQIVMRAARMIRDGQSDIALRDMGFTPEVAASLKSDLAHVAKWDDNDKLMEFDLTRVSDARTAEAFVQAVHRGTSQIIQGTFVGERNAWFHNDYLRLLLQLRTFGLTASEKQWGRTRMNHGYAYASGVMLGQMALALPIYMAKLQVMTLGMSEDAKQKFLKQNMTPGALVKATMNYSSVSGNTGDVLELLTGIAGGWAKSQQTKDLLGVGSQATSVRSISPAVSSADAALRVVGGHADVHTALKQLPFSNLWYLAPGLNLTKDK